MNERRNEPGRYARNILYAFLHGAFIQIYSNLNLCGQYLPRSTRMNAVDLNTARKIRRIFPRILYGNLVPLVILDFSLPTETINKETVF